MTADSSDSLKFKDLASEIGRYTYRPGWTLHVAFDPREGPCLWVLADVIDGYNPERSTPLRIRSLIPPMADIAAFQRWLSWRLQVIESHESREYLHYDGGLVANPHDVIELEDC